MSTCPYFGGGAAETTRCRTIPRLGPLRVRALVGVRGADHAHDALAADHLALHADLLHRSTDLHGFLQPIKTPRKSLSFRPHPLPRLAPPGPTRNEGSAANNSDAAACQGTPGPPEGGPEGRVNDAGPRPIYRTLGR